MMVHGPIHQLKHPYNLDMSEIMKKLLAGYKDQYERGVVRGELIIFEFHPTDKSLDNLKMMGEVETPVIYYNK